MRKDIFGKSVLFSLDQTKFSERLKKELSLYKNSKKTNEIVIKINEKERKNYIAQNTNTNYIYKNALKIDYKPVGIYISKKKEKLEIDLNVKETENKKNIKNIIKKYRNMQCSTTNEDAGKILHEWVLYMFPYIFKDIAPVHCSGFEKDGEATLIGGTGGIGKTTILLSIADTKVNFINDDIAMITRDGKVYPNYAFPKIYAYNTKDNKELEKLLLDRKKINNKIHWHIKKSIDPKSVRRRINPTLIYNKTEKEIILLKRYFILARVNTNKIKVKKLDLDRSVEITKNIMMAENIGIDKHVYWHQANSNIIDREKIIDRDKVYLNWKMIYEEAFKNIDRYLIEIPFDIDFRELKQKIKDIIIN